MKKKRKNNMYQGQDMLQLYEIRDSTLSTLLTPQT